MDKTYFYKAGDRTYDTNELSFLRPCMMSYYKGKKNTEKLEEVGYPYLTMLYFDSGNGIFETNGQKYPINTNDFFVINHSQPFRFYTEVSNVPITYYAISVVNFHIGARDMDTISDDGFVSYSFRSPSNEVYSGLKAIEKELTEKEFSYHTKSDSLFLAMMTDVIRLFLSIPAYIESRVKLSNEQDIAAIKNYIDVNYLSPLELKSILKQKGLTTRDFLRQFKAVYQKSAVRYVDGKRIEEAKRRIDSGETDLSRVAKNCGFADEGEMQRVFKRATGVTLKSYLNFNGYKI